MTNYPTSRIKIHSNTGYYKMRIHPIPNSSPLSPCASCAPRVTYYALNTLKEKTQNKKKLLVVRLKGLRELKAENLLQF
jgi:hypothetical protein